MANTTTIALIFVLLIVFNAVVLFFCWSLLTHETEHVNTQPKNQENSKPIYPPFPLKTFELHDSFGNIQYFLDGKEVDRETYLNKTQK